MRGSLLTTCLLIGTVLGLRAQAGSTEKVVREVYLMGTLATLEVDSPGRSMGVDMLEGFVRILEDSERELSTWQEDSSVSQMNRRRVGTRFPLDPKLCDLFKELKVWHERTGGAFDPGLGALVRAWGLRDGPPRPGAGEIESALQHSGFANLRIDPDCMAIRLTEVVLDSGGFGKGWALDQVLRNATQEGVKDWMINLGGQVLVGGSESRSVGLAHPARREAEVLEISLESGSIATSGSAERTGHILDPRTGQQVSRADSVAVWHPRALVADVLSTALYVMGVEEGLTWADENGIAVCFLVPMSEGVAIRASSAFKRRFFDP